MPLLEASRAVNTARLRAPPLTLKPTALASLLAGRVTAPDSALKVAPVPMNSVAPVTDTESNSPFSTAAESSKVGSSTPVSTERLTLTVARPNTTSAMLKPTVPPIWKVGSVGPRSTLALASPLVVNPVCFQSSTAAPVTLVWLSFRYSAVPVSLNASTPCKRAVPRAPSKPVYLRGVSSVLYEVPLLVERLRAVNTPRSNEPPVTLKPTADVSVGSGSVRVPLAVFKEAPVPMNSVA